MAEPRGDPFFEPRKPSRMAGNVGIELREVNAEAVRGDFDFAELRGEKLTGGREVPRLRSG